MQMKVCVSLFSSGVQFRCWRKGAPFWLESIIRLFSVLISTVLSPAASTSFLYCVFVLFCCKMYHGFPPVHFFLQKKYNLSFFLNIPRHSNTGPLLTLRSLSPLSLWPQVLQIFLSGPSVFSLSNPQFLWPRRIIEVWMWRRVLQSSFWPTIRRMHE